MKHFKLMKGMLACLLSLALVVTCFTPVGAKADETTPTKYTVTLDPNGGSGDDVVKSVDKAANYDVPDSLPKGWEAPEKKVFDSWNTKEDGTGTKTSGKISISADTTLYAIYKDAPKVTFTVKVECPDNNVKGDYTYTADELYLKDQTIALTEILEGAKSGSSGEKTLEDTSAWILNTNEGKSKDLLKDDANLTFANGTFKAKAALTADKAVTVYVAPTKLNIKFKTTVKEGEKNVTYTSTFAVDNGAKTKTKISYADIAAGLKTTSGSGEDAEEIALTGKVVTEIGDIVQKGKYNSWTYEVANNVIGIADFTDVDIDVADAFTENSGYDPATDSIYFESPVEATVYWVDVKKAAGGTFTAKSFKSLDLKKGKDPEGNEGVFNGSLSLCDKSAGLKVGENKATYLYVTIAEPATEKTKYAANYIVEATPYKKIAVTLAFAQADKENEGDPAIASITTTDNKNKSVTYSGRYDAETNSENYLYGGTAKSGEQTIRIDDSDVFENLQYSIDGTTWYNVNAEAEIVKGKPVKRALDSAKVYELVNSGSKSTIYFRISGGKAEDAVVSASGEELEAAKNAYRATKAIKFAVNASKEAKAVKVSVSTGTLALKNGYDYFVTYDKKATPFAPEAVTILPFNKDGKATYTNAEGEEVATTTIQTGDYTPVKKAKENAKMFTNTKVKSVLIEEITEGGINENDAYIWIRKSATANKPADKWVCITLAKVTAAPTITKVKGQNYYSVQDAADTKGTVAAPEVKNATSDKNSGAYEYLIVDAADYSAEDGLKVDLSTAKWNTLGEKGVTVGKDKSKYANAAGKKATAHVLKEGSIILIRRAGDKSSNILASQFTFTTIVKQDVEIEVEKDGKKAKETKSLYVWKEYTPEA